MQRTRPFPGHPEFSIVNYPGCREYCVENFHIARDGSGRVVRKATGLTWYWAIIPALFSLTPVSNVAFSYARALVHVGADIWTTLARILELHHGYYALREMRAGYWWYVQVPQSQPLFLK